MSRHRMEQCSSPRPRHRRQNLPSLRVGRVSDGVVTAFIPDPVEKATTTSAAEGVAADAQGNIYGAEVGPKRLMRYVKQ
jgi:hypothetical protein